MALTSIAENIQYFQDSLQRFDPGCSCHSHPPCSRCVESEDRHGNNIYQKFTGVDIIFFNEEVYSKEFGYDPTVGYFHLLTRYLPSGDVVALGGHDLRAFNAEIHGMKGNIIIVDDIIEHGDIIDPMPGAITWVKNALEPKPRHYLDKPVINGICRPHETRTGPLLLRDASEAGKKAGRTLANHLLQRSVHHACNLPSPHSHHLHLASRDTKFSD